MLRGNSDLPSSAQAPLEIRLFGELQLARAGFEIVPFPTRKSRSIFGQLVLAREKPHFRDQLAECFWPEADPNQSRAALRTELWRIRLTIARYGVNPRNYLNAGIDTIQFRPAGPILVDTELFDQAFRPEPDCATVLALYRADLLEGEYGDWCRFQREHYRSRFVDVLESAMERAMAAGNFCTALDLGNRLVSLDPLAEHIHRKLIACHAARGNRSAALKQYARCVSLLEQELHVMPMAETQALADRIRGGAEQRIECVDTDEGRTALHLAHTILDEAARTLGHALVARHVGLD